MTLTRVNDGGKLIAYCLTVPDAMVVYLALTNIAVNLLQTTTCVYAVVVDGCEKD